eukprot:TCALIF_03080-PA protein Name:"Protein of unknown function" AED:0.94 eAED:0.94 QI:0/0/0/0.2/1/1/5/0/132
MKREEEEFSEEFSLIRSGMAPLRCAHLRISERSRRLLIQAQDSGQVQTPYRLTSLSNAWSSSSISSGSSPNDAQNVNYFRRRSSILEAERRKSLSSQQSSANVLINPATHPASIMVPYLASQGYIRLITTHQ